MSKLVVFTGNANPELAQAMVKHLNLPIGNADVGTFSDGEVAVEIQENVRGKDVFIVQSTCNPTNNNIMELLVMADALRRSSAGRITAVMPYFGYARQDRRVRSARVPITAKVVADMITAVGIDRVVTVDLHADQIQGFFDIPVDNVYGTPLFVADIERQKHDDLMVVSPDVGGVVRARALAKQLNDADLAIIDKRRPKANESQVMHIIGEVEGRTCVLVDDIVDTAGTLTQSAAALRANGAAQVLACVVHGVLSGPALERIEQSGLEKLIVTNTIPPSPKVIESGKIEVLSVASLLGKAIRSIHEETSVSSLFV